MLIEFKKNMNKKTNNLISREMLVSANNYKPLPVVISQGKGAWVKDVEGKKYLDMLSAYSALNQGHCHPKIIAAAKHQMDSLTLTSRAFHNDKMAVFLEELCSVSGYDKALLMNSGAEAVETALKAVRRWGSVTKKVENPEIIVMSSNFHGRTTTIISFSTDESSREGYGPFNPGFKIVEYGNIVALRDAIGSSTVAVLLEPIQGEAGVIIPPVGYLEACSQLCKEQNILLAVDEIQTGLGRTGRLFCYQHSNIKPDIVIVGKALGGGVYPVSGILASAEIMDVAFEPGSHGSTFGGNPLACAIASASLKVIIEEGLVENSALVGAYLKDQLLSIANDQIQEVRGKGLMVAIELTKKADSARYYSQKLMDLGVLVKGTHENIIRLAPPLIINKKDVDWAVEKIREVFN
ncbi:MAG: ornithine--oxo-acid transaminase [Glaciecola sp.]